jgi:hypothetical protein
MTRPPFDPYAILGALERARVSFVVVGALARVLHGSGEITDGVDITPSARQEHLERLQGALDELHARRPDGAGVDLATVDFDAEPVLRLDTDRGRLGVVRVPAGTRGYDDLRRAATREAIGHGLRIPVADPGDLLRMLNALEHHVDPSLVNVMRRVVELDIDGGISL